MQTNTIFGPDDVVARRARLLRFGGTQRSIARAVHEGELIRIRRDHYALPTTSDNVVRAVRVGGRLACTSALAEFGVFAYSDGCTHVHLSANRSRLRSPDDRFERLTDKNRRDVALHWSPLVDATAAKEHTVSVADALLQAIRCQPPRMAIASLDSALHARLVDRSTLDRIFQELPGRFSILKNLVDGRAESGTETLLRLIVRQGGFQFEPQVPILGVGRVDLLVEGRLVVEADSRTYHDGWERHVTDRSRDRALAELGYMTLRVLYQDLVHQPQRVAAALYGLLRNPREHHPI